MKIADVFKLVAAVAVSFSAGAVGSLFTAPAIQSDWYAALAKPALNPPAWAFGPAWTTLYVLMGISLFLIWKSDPSVAPKERGRGVVLFFIQLFLNAIWSIIFFGLQSPGWALVDIAALWLVIVLMMVVFYKISPPSSSWRTTKGHGKPAAYLLVPYLLWVSFASYLNYSIWMLN